MDRLSATTNANAASPQQYTRQWYRMMTRIWADRIELMGAVDTGRLEQSVSGGGFTATGADGLDIQMTFRFVQYGLYVDAGTGRGYRRGNGGDLAFLAKGRKGRKGQRHRQRRPWFSRSWAISREVLKDHLARIIGDRFKGAVAQIARGSIR